uniref:Uncharacterized protein n=1 Tax=Anguilla anguilla TaxID=7936 RepID=A0A0E9Q142_ANGAN
MVHWYAYCSVYKCIKGAVSSLQEFLYYTAVLI